VASLMLISIEKGWCFSRQIVFNVC